MSKRNTRRVGAGVLFATLAFGCNRVAPAEPAENNNTLEDFLPPTPAPTGDPQLAFAGVLSAANLAQERIDGPSAQGLPGDLFLRNDKIRVVIQQPGREMALIPSGGNIVDADLIRDPSFDLDGNPANGFGNDHWGELSILFQLGRIVDTKRCEVVSDGSGGGAALIRCFGTDDICDFLNLPGVLGSETSVASDPDKDLNLDIAIDYLLEPGDDFVQVRYTIFNPGDQDIETPVGILGDIGGISEPFIPTVGFGGAGFDDLLNPNSGLNPVPYAAVQAPGVGYGVLPFFLDPVTQTEDPNMTGIALVISGGLAMAFELTNPFGITTIATGLTAESKSATTTGFDFVVGQNDVGVSEARFQELRKNQTTVQVSGKVTLGANEPVTDARVAVFKSTDDVLDAEEKPVTVFATDSLGNYTGKLAPGEYLLVADAEGALRAAPQRVNLQGNAQVADFALPEPGKITYTVQDVTNPNNAFLTPAKINIIGDDPNPVDKRFRDVKASSHANLPRGVVGFRHTRTGTSSSDPEGAILVEPGHYRIVVSRGIEYDRFEQIFDIDSGETINFNALLTQVVDSTSYVKTDFHQHSVNSPDAPVDLDTRAITYAAEGTEFFASTDHDFRTDYEPVLARLDLDQFVDSIIGEETTTFDYGHFNAFPFEADTSKPNNGAIDWGRGTDFFNLLPGEIFAKMRDDGARVIQINHPRSASSFTFQEFFEQCRINYDFEGGIIDSDIASSSNAVFRLPEGVPLFSDNFDAVELYNGFDLSDLNNDGVREERRVEIILRDYFNMLSLGKIATMVGTSDTHSTQDPIGSPGTYVNVGNDSAAAILNNQLREPILAAISGRKADNTPSPRDAIVTNAPFIRVTVNNQSVIGAVIPAQNGSITLRVHVEAPEWAKIDTIDVFANRKFENAAPGDPLDGSAVDSLVPDLCFTSRQNRDPEDVCDQKGPAGNLVSTVITKNALTGAKVQITDLDVTIDLDQLENVGPDAWIVIRAYGTGSLFPVVPGISGGSVAAVVDAADVSATAQGGVFPLAITNAVLVDGNGDGRYKGVFEK